MAPFIKYTFVEETKTGQRSETRFINAAQIVEAYFSDDTGDLSIVTIREGGKGEHLLKGQEALVAFKKLEDL